MAHTESQLTRHPAGPTVPGTARRVLAAFLLTFMTARIVVLLIMSRRVPDLYMHMGGTHVHHLNYGIFLLSGVGGYLVFARPTGRCLTAATLVYGIGLGLTFDEFGMWLHLGGPYWQRASFDAIVVIAALLGLLAAAPSLKRFRPRHWTTAVITAVVLIIFGVLLWDSLQYSKRILGPKLQQIEANSPT